MRVDMRALLPAGRMPMQTHHQPEAVACSISWDSAEDSADAADFAPAQQDWAKAAATASATALAVAVAAPQRLRWSIQVQ